MKINDSSWPLVVITLPQVLAPNTVEGMRVFSERAFARGQRYVTIVDATRLQHAPDAMFRRQLAEMMNEPGWRAASARYVVGSCIAVTSAIIRAAGTAINWLAATPHPVHYAPDLPSGVEWCVARLQDAGVPANPAMRDFLASLKAGKTPSVKVG